VFQPCVEELTQRDFLGCNIDAAALFVEGFDELVLNLATGRRNELLSNPAALAIFEFVTRGNRSNPSAGPFLEDRAFT